MFQNQTWSFHLLPQVALVAEIARAQRLFSSNHSIISETFVRLRSHEQQVARFPKYYSKI
jgi:hypothetical protein